MKFTDDFIKNNLFLYDTFAKKIILAKNRDEFAPPERYFYVACGGGKADIYIDTIWVNREQEIAIDYAYTYEESWNVDRERFLEMFYSFIESKGLPRKRYNLRRRIYPKERFIEILKKYYEEDNDD